MNLYPGQRYIPECIQKVSVSGLVNYCNQTRCRDSNDCSFVVTRDCGIEALEPVKLDLGTCVSENVGLIVGVSIFCLLVVGTITLFGVYGFRFISERETDPESKGATA